MMTNETSSVLYNNLAQEVLQRLDHKFTKGNFKTRDEQTEYTFHLTILNDALCISQLELFIKAHLHKRGFIRPKVKITRVSPVYVRTFIKEIYHKHNGVTCPTYYLTTVCPILDFISVVATGTISVIGKTQRKLITKRDAFTHKVKIQLAAQDTT